MFVSLTKEQKGLWTKINQGPDPKSLKEAHGPLTWSTKWSAQLDVCWNTALETILFPVTECKFADVKLACAVYQARATWQLQGREIWTSARSLTYDGQAGYFIRDHQCHDHASSADPTQRQGHRTQDGHRWYVDAPSYMAWLMSSCSSFEIPFAHGTNLDWPAVMRLHLAASAVCAHCGKSQCSYCDSVIFPCFWLRWNVRKWDMTRSS